MHLVFAISSLLLFSLIGQGECDEVGLGPKVYDWPSIVMAFGSFRACVLD